MYVNLKEASIRKFIDFHSKNGYAIVSASRAELSDEELASRDEELVKLISSEGWSYTRIFGDFIEKKDTPEETKVIERSVVIYNYNRANPSLTIQDLKQLAIAICKKYNQDSVLVKEPNLPPTYYKKDGSVDFALGNDFTVRDAAQDYFSSMNRNKKKTLSGKNTISFKEAENDFKPVRICVNLPETVNGHRSRTHRGEMIPPIAKFMNLDAFDKNGKRLTK